jgi:hypothetical protein
VGALQALTTRHAGRWGDSRSLGEYSGMSLEQDAAFGDSRTGRP